MPILILIAPVLACYLDIARPAVVFHHQQKAIPQLIMSIEVEPLPFGFPRPAGE
jgi:hypothetical protein